MRTEARSVPAEKAFAELSRLKAEGYNFLVDITAVDYSSSAKTPAPRKERFDVIYRLACVDLTTGLETQDRVEVHCSAGESPVLRSARSLWPAADWLEREVWDMFGVGFTDRPDIKRLLLYKEFVGHPLRKDYPIKKRQPLIGPKSGELADSPSFNITRQDIPFE